MRIAKCEESTRNALYWSQVNSSIEDYVKPCCLAKHIGQIKQKYKGGRIRKNWSQNKQSRTAYIAREQTNKQTSPCLLL